MSNVYRKDGWAKNTLGPAVAGAQIYVCSQPANTDFLPPDPLASIFSDPGGLVPIAQPIFTDGFGHYDYYVAPGLYTEVIAFGGKVQQVYPDQSLGNINTGGGPSIVAGAGIATSTDSSGNVTINSLTDLDDQITVISVDKLIPIDEGVVLITKTSQAHLTLNPPIAGAQPTGDDGRQLRLVAVTAFAHVITTNTAAYNNGTKFILTLVPPSSGLLVAYGGAWYVITNNAGTLS